MLQKVTVQNFVYFREKQSLDFQEGCYFLIGGNNSGKSSLFELIQQCMGVRKSTGFTSPYAPDKPSIAVCTFKIDNGTITSAFIRPKLKAKDIYLKLVVENIGKSQEIGINVISANGGDTFKGFEIDIDTCISSILGFIHDEPGKFIESLVSIIEPILTGNEQEDTLVNTKCNKLLEKHVDKTSVIIFPNRSISTCQWTKSKQCKQKEEIIAWYLKKINNTSSNGISEEEQALEKKYFRLITSSTDYQFEYDEDKQEVIVKNAAFCDRIICLYKVPAGIYEAKKLAILLALRKFHTACLDEPDTGMHPQMIEMVRHVVSTQIKNKVVLLISHSPTFISLHTRDKLFYFNATTSESRRESNIIPSQKRLLTGKGNEEDCKIPRIISGQSPHLFFAERLLLVEGDSDYIFMTELKQLLLTNDAIRDRFLELSLEQKPKADEIEKFEQCLSSLCVLQMFGESNKYKYRDVCKEFKMRGLFLFDNDALWQNTPGQTEQKTEDEDPSEFLKRFFDDETEKTLLEKVKDGKCLEECLEEYCVFVWKEDIENAAVHLAEKDRILKDVYRKNKVNLSPPQKETPGTSGEQTQDGAGANRSGQSDRKRRKTDSHDMSSGTSVKPAHIDDTSNQKSVSTSPKPEKKKKIKQPKLFSNARITGKNISTFVLKTIEKSQECTYSESEFKRLVLFLCKMLTRDFFIDKCMIKMDDQHTARRNLRKRKQQKKK